MPLLTFGVGDCLELLADDSPTAIDCAAPTAVYEVAVARPGRDGMFVNEDDEATDVPVPAKVECGPDTAVVTKVVPDGADDDACPAATELPKAYPEPSPGRTVCMDIW